MGRNGNNHSSGSHDFRALNSISFTKILMNLTMILMIILIGGDKKGRWKTLKLALSIHISSTHDIAHTIRIVFGEYTNIRIVQDF